MRLTLFLLLLSACFVPASAQKGTDAIINLLQNAPNDSVVISTYSSEKYKVHTATESEATTVEKFLLKKKPGEVIRMQVGEETRLYKIQAVDSAWEYHVSNIYLGASTPDTKVLAEKIVAKAEAGEDFDLLCKSHSTSNAHLKDCDLGWFFGMIMVESFTSAIKVHRKGDIFYCETEFGYHVVRINDNARFVPYRIRYVVLVL